MKNYTYICMLKKYQKIKKIIYEQIIARKRELHYMEC